MKPADVKAEAKMVWINMNPDEKGKYIALADQVQTPLTQINLTNDQDSSRYIEEIRQMQHKASASGCVDDTTKQSSILPKLHATKASAPMATRPTQLLRQRKHIEKLHDSDQRPKKRGRPRTNTRSSSRRSEVKGKCETFCLYRGVTALPLPKWVRGSEYKERYDRGLKYEIKDPC